MVQSKGIVTLERESSYSDQSSNSNKNDDDFHAFSADEGVMFESDDNDDDDDGGDGGDDDEQEEEKDDTELELETLVFGDDAGFKKELKRESQQFGAGKKDVEDFNQGDRALAIVEDSDLYFMDSGPKTQVLMPHTDPTSSLPSGQRLAPAWQDSEDEKMMVSLMAVPRLRKLRNYEGEDIISGKEYTRRLRQQFELLNPRPKWADWMLETRSRKRRRGSGSDTSSVMDGSLDESDEGSDTEMSTQPLAKLLRGSNSLIQSSQLLPNKRRKFQAEVVSVERMKDILPSQPSAITSLSIHPTLSLILSSGPSSTLYLHHLHPHPIPPDPPNPLITSLHLKHTPLSTTAFSSPSIQNPDIGPRIYMSSRRRYFHSWDLPSGSIKKITRIYGHAEEQKTMEMLKPSPCGRYVALKGSGRKGGGVINILDSETLQWVSQVRVESPKGVADFAWWRDGTGMTIAGKGGEVSEWSIEKEEVVARWQDEGAVGTTTLTLGGEAASRGKAAKHSDLRLGPDRWIAIGSTAGIVNIYDRSIWMLQITNSESKAMIPPHPKPTKTLENLTTPISNLAISPCGQILAMSSRWKRDALRLVHLPSCTVYRNWPTAKTPLGRISALAFGEYDTHGNEEDTIKSLVLAVGNEAGALRAWEIGR